MRIYVSAKDIEKGRNRVISNTHCPVALAMKRAGLKNVEVGVEWFKATGYPNPTYRPNLPKSAVKFISDLCGDIVGGPFSFSVRKVNKEKNV